MKELYIFSALAIAFVANAAPIKSSQSQSQSQSQPILKDKNSSDSNNLDYIGSVEMLKDGTIFMKLFTEFPGGGGIAEAEFRHKPGDPEYENILHHVGGLKPGEAKPVTRWLDRPGHEKINPEDIKPAKVKRYDP